MPTPIVRRLRAARAILPALAALAAAPACAQELPLHLFRSGRGQ